MNCRRVANLMSAYVDGELTGLEMLEIRRHLGECPDCAEECESIRFTKKMVLRLATVKPREDFAASIIMNLDAIEVPRYQKIFDSMAAFMHRKLSPVAAALAVSGAALVILSAGGVDGVRPGSGNQIAMSQQGGRSFGVGYSSSIPAGSFSIENRPLEVRDNVNELTHANIELASLTVR
ncbi:MAG: anti-sigma factor [Armatimonadota bacterium]|nr:zf-HC2 domain-containing protein [bacterium]